MKITEFEKGGVTQQQLDALESVLDKVFAKLGIDVEFTRHFLDRVNDERNVHPISIKELGMLFKKEFIKWGKPIAQMGPDAQAVMKDLETDINIPFVLQWNDRKGELELIAKTVMRKKNFKTSNKEFPVESQLNENPLVAVAMRILAKKGIKIAKHVIQGIIKNSPPGASPEQIAATIAKGVAAGGAATTIAKKTKDALDNKEIAQEQQSIGSKINFPGMQGKTVTPTATQAPKPQPKKPRNRFDKIVNWAKGLFDEDLNEDFGSIPPLVDLIVMAVLAQTTVGAMKIMWKTALKTGKGIKSLRKLQKAAMRSGEKVADFALGEATREEMIAAVRSGQEKEFYKAAIQALHRLIQSKGDRQSIRGYAFDISRAFAGIDSKKLIDMYKAQYESIQERDVKQSNPLVVLDKISDRSDIKPFPVKFYDGETISVNSKQAKRFMDVYYRMEPEQKDIVHKYIKTKKGFMQAIKNLNITECWKDTNLNEGYKLQLERDNDMYVLHITDNDTGKRTEVRGKSGYESGNYDADDKLHQLLDRIGKASNISDLMNGEVVGINPKHPDGASAKKHADTAFNEAAGVGRVVKGVNTTVDVGPNEIIKQVKKYGNDVDRDGFPKKRLK